ncbi:hypothetical protein LAZ67_8002358 [Cordylochernes scorpioides]|uniref:Transposase n=1 Tax=Cordylochernes scorpioides TaxID=51811 RepID=A0ABY6KQW3_9ARAC|nr:hypothetical protein LAZ67_8002358 [Cordylochernes scorpioides]
MPLPPYSPDLAPCDFFLFSKLKRPMKGRRYATLDEIKTASKEELKKILKNDFLKCFEDWKNRWHNRIDLKEKSHRREILGSLTTRKPTNKQNDSFKGFHRRVKAKTSLQDDDIPIDNTTTKPLFTPQEKGRKGTRDKVPRLRWNPWQKLLCLENLFTTGRKPYTPDSTEPNNSLQVRHMSSGHTISRLTYHRKDQCGISHVLVFTFLIQMDHDVPSRRPLNQTAVLHTQEHYDCCERDVWRHLRLFIGHNSNRELTQKQLYTPKNITTAVIEMYGDI